MGLITEKWVEGTSHYSLTAADKWSMSGQETQNMHDAYRSCEGSCTHDLARGVLVSELLDDEGPYPDSHPLLSTPPLGGGAAVLRALIVPAAS